GKRLVCPDLRVPKQGGRVRRLGAEDRRHLRKSPNPRGAQRLGRPAKAKHVKRAALVGCDRPNRVAVAKPEAAARHRGERSAVGRNRVRVAPRKSAIKRELETNALLGPQESGQGWIRTSEGVKPADLQSAPFGHFGTYPFAFGFDLLAEKFRDAIYHVLLGVARDFRIDRQRERFTRGALRFREVARFISEI